MDSPSSPRKSLLSRASASARRGASIALGGISKLNPITSNINKAIEILEHRKAYWSSHRPMDGTEPIYDRAIQILKNTNGVKFMALHPFMQPAAIPKYLADYAESTAYAENALRNRVVSSKLRDSMMKGMKEGGKKKGKSRKSSKSSKTRKNRKTRSRK
jgi:hypothetical protein